VSNTLPVAEYLSGMGIEATFFVVGQPTSWTN
jgi:hypothetical protein